MTKKSKISKICFNCSREERYTKVTPLTRNGPNSIVKLVKWVAFEILEIAMHKCSGNIVKKYKELSVASSGQFSLRKHVQITIIMQNSYM